MMILKELRQLEMALHADARVNSWPGSLQGMSYSFNRLDFSLNMKV